MNKIALLWVLLLLACTNNIAFSNQSQRKIKISPFTPEQIKNTLKQYDIDDVMAYIMKERTVDKGKPYIILQGIREGNDEWLDLFVQFKDVSDALWSEELDFAIGYAIGKNPQKVLKVINDRYPRYALEVCGDLTEDILAPDEGNDKKYAPSALKELTDRIQSVNTVTDISLSDVKNYCLEALHKSKEKWKEKLDK